MSPKKERCEPVQAHTFLFLENLKTLRLCAHPHRHSGRFTGRFFLGLQAVERGHLGHVEAMSVADPGGRRDERAVAGGRDGHAHRQPH